MKDYYLEATRSPFAQKLVRTLGLPAPPQLERADGAWQDKPLEGSVVCIGAIEGGDLVEAALDVCAGMGAIFATSSNDTGGDAVRSIAAGKHQVDEAEPATGAKPYALVFDASGIRTPAQLSVLHAFFHPLARVVRRCGRVLILAGQVESAADPIAAAASRALEGFARSLAKELGRKGITVQVLRVEAGAEARLAGPMRFFLSRHSAYVDGQVVSIRKQTQSRARQRIMAPLEGRVAVVTGAAQGIGAAIAAALAREGARVVCLDLPGASQALSEIAERVGGEALEVDISAEGAPARIAQYLDENHKGVDVVIHNAGITRDKTIGRMSSEQWNQVLAVNLEAPIRIDEALLDGVMRRNGRIVCLSSITGIAGNVGQTNYAASKAGIIGYVEARSRETAAGGITVNAVAPGFIETRMTDAMPVALRQIGRRLNSLSQGGLPEDVAEAVTFLASPGAVGITGSVLRVCGQSLLGA